MPGAICCAALTAAVGSPDEPTELFRALYDDLGAHGFELRPLQDAIGYGRQTREAYAPAMEYLIDDLLCPRGFWSIDSTVRRWSADHEIARVDRSG